MILFTSGGLIALALLLTHDWNCVSVLCFGAEMCSFVNRYHLIEGILTSSY